MSFLLFSCVFRWFWRDLVKCYVSVQVTYLLDMQYLFVLPQENLWRNQTVNPQNLESGRVQIFFPNETGSRSPCIRPSSDPRK